MILASLALLPLLPISSVVSAPALVTSVDEVVVESAGLTFDLPTIDDVDGGLEDLGQRQGVWRGTLGGDGISITFWMLGKKDFGFVEPEQVTGLIQDNLEGRENPPLFGSFQYFPGNYGFVSYGTMVRAEVFDGTEVASEKWILSGILEEYGYALEIDLMDRADEAQVEAIETFLREGIAYTGPERDAEWTEEEVEERLAEDLPSSLDGERISDPIRTDHYIVFGNSSGAKAFARNIERYYDTIKEAFPFEEVEGQRLMPVFLFRTRDQYLDFLQEKIGWTREQAARSGGVASGDWYATTYDDPKDSVHIHELTHQIFKNRLLVSGGGSWLQEGVAVYVETLEYKEEQAKVVNVGKRVGKDGIEEATAEG
ncbi:MAG: hypothetical protein ACYTFV_09200, partial [Planctomycetota bacterium]